MFSRKAFRMEYIRSNNYYMTVKIAYQKKKKLYDCQNFEKHQQFLYSKLVYIIFFLLVSHTNIQSMGLEP